ncbi:hypothetical protein PRIPAC_74180 [Pristionchus pacificus]|uniref:Uncharacterized protein n=1 Tax=Pristionchus pacificus TaxID=54126 RepID=A0A2A6CGF5_PRIPA|nr:hypothetical protein PRIPAC_74180 [Pristionchus pacificus]|eukprot:PDM77294.1 hypothetical protein PRIPAC_43206 [Pristionchus pacificus]
MPSDVRPSKTTTSPIHRPHPHKRRGHKTSPLPFSTNDPSKKASSHSTPLIKPLAISTTTKKKDKDTTRASSSSSVSLPSPSPTPSDHSLPRWEYDRERDGPILEPYEGPEDDDVYDESIPILRGVRQTDVVVEATSITEPPRDVSNKKNLVRMEATLRPKRPAAVETHNIALPTPSTRIPKISRVSPKPAVIEASSTIVTTQHSPPHLPTLIESSRGTRQKPTNVVAPMQQQQHSAVEPRIPSSYSPYDSDSESHDDVYSSSLMLHLIGITRLLEEQEREEDGEEEEPPRKRSKRRKSRSIERDHSHYVRASYY